MGVFLRMTTCCCVNLITAVTFSAERISLFFFLAYSGGMFAIFSKNGRP